MSFFRAVGNAIRQGKQFRNTQEAYRMVVRYFHLDVSQQSIRETSPYLHRMADTSSVQELAVEYLNHYGRRRRKKKKKRERCIDPVREMRASVEQDL